MSVKSNTKIKIFIWDYNKIRKSNPTQFIKINIKSSKYKR
jgi:hypothetical protein